MSDIQAYENYLKMKEESAEILCKRCGACCGAFENDPCSHLFKEPDGRYACSVYENRLGLHKTVAGREFRCVPLRKIFFESWQGSWQCGYKRAVNSI